MRRQRQKRFVVQMILLMFEEPQGHPGQSNEDNREQELQILTEASQRDRSERCHVKICKQEGRN